jgi:hypothetical protein
MNVRGGTACCVSIEPFCGSGTGGRSSIDRPTLRPTVIAPPNNAVPAVEIAA